MEHTSKVTYKIVIEINYNWKYSQTSDEQPPHQRPSLICDLIFFHGCTLLLKTTLTSDSLPNATNDLVFLLMCDFSCVIF